MKTLVWCLLGLLVVLHQDYWQWGNSRLVFGFLPYTLAYHAGLSISAAVAWLLATKYCWPGTFDQPAGETAADVHETTG